MDSLKESQEGKIAGGGLSGFGVGKMLLAGLGLVIGGSAVKHIVREMESQKEEEIQKQLEKRYDDIIISKEESLDDCYGEDWEELE